MKDHYSLLECMSCFFFCYNVCLFDKSRSFFSPQDDILQKMLTYAICSQNGGTLGYKYLFRMKDHYNPLECMSCFFFVIMCICLTNHVRFLLHSTIFCEKMLTYSNFFSKWWNSGIQIFISYERPL